MEDLLSLGPKRNYPLNMPFSSFFLFFHVYFIFFYFFVFLLFPFSRFWTFPKQPQNRVFTCFQVFWDLEYYHTLWIFGPGLGFLTRPVSNSDDRPDICWLVLAVGSLRPTHLGRSIATASRCLFWCGRKRQAVRMRASWTTHFLSFLRLFIGHLRS